RLAKNTQSRPSPHPSSSTRAPRGSSALTFPANAEGAVPPSTPRACGRTRAPTGSASSLGPPDVHRGVFDLHLVGRHPVTAQPPSGKRRGHVPGDRGLADAGEAREQQSEWFFIEPPTLSKGREQPPGRTVRFARVAPANEAP